MNRTRSPANTVVDQLGIRKCLVIALVSGDPKAAVKFPVQKCTQLRERRVQRGGAGCVGGRCVWGDVVSSGLRICRGPE